MTTSCQSWKNEDNYGYLNEWKQKLDRITNPMDPPGERISDMLKFFQPDFIVNQLLSIQQNMEAFDCPE